MNHIYLIATFIAGALVFSLVRKIILSIIKKRITPPSLITNASVGNVYKKNGKEVFQWKKLFKIFDLGDGVEWIKSIKEILDLRKLVIYGLIIGTVFAYGWYQGKQGKPIRIDLGYGKEARIKLDGHYLHINKEGEVFVEDKDGTQIKQIAVKDIPVLKKKLAPIGFQLEPVGIVGGGLNKDGIQGEMGVGVSWLRYWKWRLDSFITNRGLYPLGTSYKITDNSGIGIGIGKGWKGDERIEFYYTWKF